MFKALDSISGLGEMSWGVGRTLGNLLNGIRTERQRIVLLVRFNAGETLRILGLHDEGQSVLLRVVLQQCGRQRLHFCMVFLASCDLSPDPKLC